MGMGMGMGNLADELDQLDDEDEGVDGEATEVAVEDAEAEGARDSGIDVSYASSAKSGAVKNFSKPFGTREQSGEQEEEEDAEDELTPELEEAMNAVARIASYAPSTSEDPLIPRVMALLQDLGNQSNLEAGVQRLQTATNAMTSHLGVQSRSLQSLMTQLYSPLAVFTAPLDPFILDGTIPLIDVLLHDLPLPDPAPLQGIQKLERETANVVHTLSSLTDTLQMGKHTTNTASRHLRTTQTMVADLRRERERAEAARTELGKSDWNDKIQKRGCASECKAILGGFESKCDELRSSLVSAGGGG